MGARYKLRTRRDKNEPDIIHVLREGGALVWQLDEPCDLLVGYKGQWCAVEVKEPYGPGGGCSTHGQKLSDKEAFFAGHCVKYDLEYACVRTCDHARALLKRLAETAETKAA
jgi:hypothetical protein